MNPRVGEPDPGATVDLGELTASPELRQRREAVGRQVFRAAHEPGALVVDDHEGDGLQAVPAGHGAADEACHDVATLA